MATDEGPQQPDDDMLPDEREVLPERGQQLEEMDEEDLLTVDEVADNLGIELE